MLQDVTYNPLDSLSPIRVDDNPELFPHVAGYTYHLDRDSSITQVWTATKIQTEAVPSRIEVMTPGEKYVDMGVVIFLIIFFLVATERIVEGLARAVWAAFIPKRHEDIDNEMALRSSRNIAAFFLLPTALFAVSRTPEKFLLILAVCVLYFAVKYGIMAIMDYVNRTSVFKFTGRMGLDYVIIASVLLLTARINPYLSLLCIIPALLYLIMEAIVLLKNNFSVFFYILYLCSLELLPAALLFRLLL